MNDIKELERYAKEIGFITPDESLDEQYNYAEIASTWKANEMINLIQQTKHEKFHSVLEVGCGYSMILQKISQDLNIPRAVGIDNHELTLKMAKKISPNCIYTIMDAYNLSFPDDSFDLVILSDIIEHLENPELLLKEARRVSKYSVFKIPLEKCLINLRRQYGSQDSSGHMFSLDETSAINLINQAGFTILNKSTHQPPDLWGGERFKRFKFIAPVLRFIAKFLQNYTPKVYELIFGKSLFIFCKNK